MKNIEKQLLYERVEALYHKHNHDFDLMRQDLSFEKGRDIPIYYLYNVWRRIEAKTAIEVGYGSQASEFMVKNAIAGHRARCQYLYEMLRRYNSTDRILVSMCHEYPVTEVGRGRNKQYFCAKCNTRTKPFLQTQKQEVDIQLAIIKRIEEDFNNTLRAVSEAAKTRVESGHPMNQEVSLHLHGVGGRGGEKRRSKVVLTKENQKLVEDMRYMLPQDREKILKNIQAQLVDDELDKMGFPKTEEDITR